MFLISRIFVANRGSIDFVALCSIVLIDVRTCFMAVNISIIARKSELNLDKGSAGWKTASTTSISWFDSFLFSSIVSLRKLRLHMKNGIFLLNMKINHRIIMPLASACMKSKGDQSTLSTIPSFREVRK